ncbi:MAG TPA: AAA family ATPase [Jatrophihabitantaceae bacterium]|nr:AAA family ATPase [Jatrophihabitantaceae bacterium]
MADESERIDFVRVLGPVQVVMASGRVVDLPSISQRRLLGVLALHPRTSLRVEWLADAVAVTPGALRTTMSRLRKLLGETVLETTATGYRLEADVDADLFLREIEAGEHEAALSRWKGAALDEFAAEAWAAGVAARLTELHASTAESVAAALLADSDWSDAVALLEGHVATYPLRDRARGLLMEALAGEGRQVDALRAFQQYRTLLADEMGAEPSDEVRAIERRIASSWASARVDIPLPSALSSPVRLIGRSFERRLLAEAVTGAATSQLQLFVLSGEPGIGKTTLLAAFAQELHGRDGHAVLYGRCDEGAAVPLQPFRGLIGWCVSHASTALLEAHAARSGGELVRIAPQLAERVSARGPTTSDDATERFLLFDSVSDLLRRVAGDGVLVVMLDDLHWAEPTALALLRHLLRALAEAPIVLIATYRDSERLSDEFRQVLADFDRSDARRIALRGFDDADLADLVAVEAGVASPGLTARLREDSAGNPLYATQLLRHWVESAALERVPETEVPPSLRDVVWTRVRALGVEPSEVLSASAVLGAEFSADVLSALVDVDQAVVDDALDAAIAADLLLPFDPATKTIRFAHALVASALYSELQPVRRRRLHERAASVLAEGDTVPSQATVVELARHCALGGLLSDAMRWAALAGDNALANLSPSEAATWYRAALEHCIAVGRPDAERAGLEVRLGTALHRSGDPTAYATLQEAAELAQRAGASDVLVRAALATDRGFLQLGTFAPQQLAIVEAAVEVVDPADVGTHARMLALYAQCLIHTPRAELREQVAREALGLADSSGDPALLSAVSASVLYALWAPGSSMLRADLAARAVTAAAASRDPFLEFTTHVAAYTVAIELADPAAAARSLSKLRAIAAEIGEPGMRWTVGIYDTFDATMAARLDDAERLVNANLELGMQIGEPDAFTVYATQFYALGTFAGRHGELFPIVEELSKEAPTASPIRIAYAVICAAVDRADTARAIFAETQAVGFSDIPKDMFWMTSIVGCAVLAVELQDADAAAAIFPVLEPFAAEVAFNGGTSQGPIAAYLGKLASLLGQHDLADGYLRAALDIAIAFGWEYHRATTLIALAQSRARRSGGLDSEAHAWLERADGICSARGLRSWAAQIELLRS